MGLKNIFLSIAIFCMSTFSFAQKRLVLEEGSHFYVYDASKTKLDQLCVVGSTFDTKQAKNKAFVMLISKDNKIIFKKDIPLPNAKEFHQSRATRCVPDNQSLYVTQLVDTNSSAALNQTVLFLNKYDLKGQRVNHRLIDLPVWSIVSVDTYLNQGNLFVLGSGVQKDDFYTPKPRQIFQTTLNSDLVLGKADLVTLQNSMDEVLGQFFNTQTKNIYLIQSLDSGKLKITKKDMDGREIKASEYQNNTIGFLANLSRASISTFGMSTVNRQGELWSWLINFDDLALSTQILPKTVKFYKNVDGHVIQIDQEHNNKYVIKW